MQGEKDLVPKLMYQISLESLVPSDNYYRRLSGLFDWGFLRKETAHYFGSEGQKSIDPVVFFKILLVGYLNNISSVR